MRRTISILTAVMVFAGARFALAQEKGPTEPGQAPAVLEAQAPEVCDNRPVINKKSLKMRGYEVVDQVDLTSFGPGWSAVLLSLKLEDAETDTLAAVNRLYILDGDRIEFDSFSFDAIEDAIEPSVSTRTFFKMKWEVRMKGKSPNGLVLTGIVPRQAQGEPVRTSNRTLVLGWSKTTGFFEAADVVSRDPARVSGGIVTVPVD
ncbi:MAG TPA: hypothetical protein PKK50_01605 [Myxococcota bacterium]|nr:hypothetical protein [Myxococcota bacterium]